MTDRNAKGAAKRKGQLTRNMGMKWELGSMEEQEEMMKRIEYMANGRLYVEPEPVRESSAHLEAYSRKTGELAAQKKTGDKKAGGRAE